MGACVPELAARDHLRKLPLLLRKSTGWARGSTRAAPVDAVAYTAGQGLIGARLVSRGGRGAAPRLCVARACAAVHHLRSTPAARRCSSRASPRSHFPRLLRIGRGALLAGDRGARPLPDRRVRDLDDAAGRSVRRPRKLLRVGPPGTRGLRRLRSTGGRRPSAFRGRSPSDPYSFGLSGLKTADGS